MQSAYTRVTFDGVADPAAVVVAGPARFTVLSSRLIRMEYAPDGEFEDRPSQVIWYRRRPVPPFRVEREGGRLILTTEQLRLEYVEDAPFSPTTLAIALLPDEGVWHYGDLDPGNLLGTTRTLDKVSGNTPLEPGLLSRSGWAVIDDSRTLVFDGSGWLNARAADESGHDLYFFGYGRRYREALGDYLALAGGVPLLPRWVLGNWWSRYWAYRDEELIELMEEFRRHEVPLSVCIVDMDWHLVDVGQGVNGWTGYTWNSDLFPDPPGFITRLHELGLRTALNLHPALGVRPHEAMYGAMAERLGIEPEAGRAIPFDVADRRFVDAYFELLHHPQEEIGVDFWWMDWQQGTQSAVAGLDPLWWLNHLHFHDLGRNGDRRPFVFSRWGGLGNHRYPIGFSGDTVVSWESLAFQPYFTATAANVAYGWWSHDIGGHMQGIEDRELYARWVQFGVFSPIFRLHSTKNPFHERRPWGYDAEVFRITREAMQLRHALIPYLYTMSHLNEVDGLSPVRPMYHDYPDREEAYACPQQYAFGADLVIAPFTAPAEVDTRLSRQAIWLPPGDWYHLFTGEHYGGDSWHTRYGALDDVPAFVRAGAILPMGPRVGWDGLENPEELHLHVFAGADGRFSLYEDDGVSTRYRGGAFAHTAYEQQWQADGLRLTIAPPIGDRSVLPERRTYHLHIYGVAAPEQATLLVDGAGRHLAFGHDPVRETVDLQPFQLNASELARVTLHAPAERPLFSRRDRTPERVEQMLHAFRLDSLAKMWLASGMDRWIAAPEHLADFGVDLSPGQVRALLESTQGCGAHYVPAQADPHLLVLWNNTGAAGFRHHFTQLKTDRWFVHERYRSSWGDTPRFQPIRPDGERWRLTVDYFGLHKQTFDAT